MKKEKKEQKLEPGKSKGLVFRPQDLERRWREKVLLWHRIHANGGFLSYTIR